MPAAFTIPQPIRQFPGGAALPVLPSMAFAEPREGKRYIPVNIGWTGAGETYELNVNGLTTQPFSQIVMLDVDNSQCGAAVTFYFPDSSDTLVVPAESGGTFPVFTNALRMYAAAPLALASDVTRFRILNYRQEPVGLPPPQFNQIATALNLAAAGTTVVVANGTTGTLVSYSVNVGLQANAGGFSGWTGTLKDHATGSVIDQATVIVTTANTFSGIVLSASGLAVRFASGLDFVITNFNSALVLQFANVAVRYRTP